MGQDRRPSSIFEALKGALSMGTFETEFGPNGIVRRWSPELIELMGFSGPQTPTEAQVRQMIHPDDRAQVAAKQPGGSTGTRPYELDYRIIRPSDGQVRWIRTVARVNLSPDGKGGTSEGVMIDVTAEREAIEALAASEERLKQVLEATTDGVAIRNTDGIIVFANQALERLLGYGPGELVGKPATVYASLGAEGEVPRELEKRAAGETTVVERPFKRHDGSVFWARARGVPLHDRHGKVIGALAYFTDLTAERRMQGAESLLEAIVESSRDAIFSRSLDGTIISFNRAAEELVGWKRSEIIGQNLLTLSGEPDRHRSLMGRAGLAPTTAEAKVKRKDGTLLDAEVSLFPLVDAHGTVIAGGGVVRDLTQQKAQEKALHRMQEQLNASQKMEAIGSLAGGIAHDFNNILSVILSCSALAQHGVPAGSPTWNDLDEIQKAGERAAALVRQLLAFSRRQMLRPKRVNLGQQLSVLAPMLDRLLGEQVELNVLAPRELPDVLADPAQLEQVVLNLCVNARDAMPQGGKLTLELSAVTLDDYFCAHHDGATAGEHVMLAVSDTGHGMSKEVRERIFEPFFSTKGELGTGLGLSTVFGIVRQSGGTIWVYSEPGKGTTFKVYLPVAKNKEGAAAAHARPALDPARGGSETVLLVEDEDHVRALMRNLLRGAGYTVLEAAGPGDALLVSEQFEATVHLLLTDVVMPRMNGRQLAERLVQRRPKMKVLYTSGYTDDAIVQHGVLDGGVEFLEKPITPDALLRKVRSVLDSG